MKKRVAWIDVAKGIAMILVVLGHNEMPNGLVPIIYCLNVPIFFMISGCTFQTKKYQNLWELVKKILIHLIIPYLIMNIVAFGVYYITMEYMPSAEDISFFLRGVLYGVGGYNALKYNIPLWFLPCIAVTQCMFYLIDKYAKRLKIIIFLCCAVLGQFIFYIVRFRLAWSVDVALTGIVFFAIGNWMRTEKIYNVLFKLNSFVGFIVMMLVNIVFNRINSHFLDPATQSMVDMNGQVFGNFFLFYICTLSGCAAIIYLAKLLQRSRALAYIGRNTIWVLGMHCVFIHIYVTYLGLNTRFFPGVLSGFLLSIMEIISVLAVKAVYDFIVTLARDLLYPDDAELDAW